MDKQLAGRLGHVQVILEELVDGEQRLLIQGVDGVLLEHLLQEHLAQGGGKLIDQAADAQILVVDDIPLGVKDLAHLDGDLGLLIRLGQLTQMLGHGADAHEHAALAVDAQSFFDPQGHLLHIAGTSVFVHLVDQHHVLLAHAENEVVLPVGEQALNQIQRSGLHPVVHRADDEHAPVHLGGHMQLLGPHVDIADEDVVGDDILHEGALVVLLFIIALGRVQRHGRHGAHRAADAVVAAGEHRIVKVSAPAGQCLEGLALQGHTLAVGLLNGLYIFAPLLADPRQLAARDNGSLGVDDPDGAVGGLFELQHYILKNSTGHDTPSCSLSKRPQTLCANCQVVAYIISS